jgi:diguanylate cyclase (GGDEF)-like protein
MNTKKQILIIILFLLMSFYGTFILLETMINKFHEQEYTDDAISLNKQIQSTIKSKEKSTMAIVLSYVQGNEGNSFFKYRNKSEVIRKKLQDFSNELKTNTAFKNVWIQIIDANGVSLARSWSDKSGDSLLNARVDLKGLIKKPKKLSSVSVGKFTLSFKSIVPVYDNNHSLEGFVEIITQFNSIIEAFQKEHYTSVVLVDKSYKEQLKNNISHTFIDNYYVVNFKPLGKEITLVKNIGVENIIQTKEPYLVHDKYFYTKYRINDIYNKPIAYYIFIKNIDTFENKKINEFIKDVRNIIVISLIFIILMILIFYKRHYDLHLQKEYFHNIVDTASEIIVISDGKKIIDANKAFFDFFHQYSTLDDFHRDYQCVCNLFIEEDGFVSQNMQTLDCREYVFKNSNQNNKVKILYDNKVSVFHIAIKKLYKDNEAHYTIALNDITQIEEYKNKLEYLSQTDTLTNIWNRRYFNIRLKQEYAKTRRYQQNLSLIMLDIDYFKKVNDIYGHNIGDKVLVTLSKEIQILLRDFDVFCRYGGEEFMILMPKISSQEASIVAQRIRQHIENLTVEPVTSFTISLGVTELLEDDTVESFIKRVDEALYMSKNNGRNIVTSI